MRVDRKGRRSCMRMTSASLETPRWDGFRTVCHGNHRVEPKINKLYKHLRGPPTALKHKMNKLLLIALLTVWTSVALVSAEPEAKNELARRPRHAKESRESKRGCQACSRNRHFIKSTKKQIIEDLEAKKGAEGSEEEKSLVVGSEEVAKQRAKISRSKESAKQQAELPGFDHFKSVIDEDEKQVEGEAKKPSAEKRSKKEKSSKKH